MADPENAAKSIDTIITQEDLESEAKSAYEKDFKHIEAKRECRAFVRDAHGLPTENDLTRACINDEKQKEIVRLGVGFGGMGRGGAQTWTRDKHVRGV